MKNDMDIVYLIDDTDSLEGEINAAKDQVIIILKELQSKHLEINFNFGSMFYIDKIDSPSDKIDFFPLIYNMENLKSLIATVRAYGGGDEPEDLVED